MNFKNLNKTILLNKYINYFNPSKNSSDKIGLFLTKLLSSIISFLISFLKFETIVSCEKIDI